MRLQNFIISNILYYEWTVFLSRFMENKFHKLFWRPISGGNIKVLFFWGGGGGGGGDYSLVRLQLLDWSIGDHLHASLVPSLLFLWTCIAPLPLTEMAASIQALYLGPINYQGLHQLKTFLTASCFIILMASMLLWCQRLKSIIDVPVIV